MATSICLLLAACATPPPPTQARRSQAAVAAFKRANPCPANGTTAGACPGYVVDHIAPLACGGPDTPANMQWQTIQEGKNKDKWERKGCAQGKKTP